MGLTTLPFMADITDDHIKEALSVACEATRKGQSQTLGAVARILELPDDDVFQALRAALDYMLVLSSQREGWGAFHPSMDLAPRCIRLPFLMFRPPGFRSGQELSLGPPMHISERGSQTFCGRPNTGAKTDTSVDSEQ